MTKSDTSRDISERERRPMAAYRLVAVEEHFANSRSPERFPQESSDAPGMNRCSVPSASLTRPRNGVQEPWTPDDHTGRKGEIARYPLQSLANPQLVECMYLRARVSHASRMQVDFAALPLTEWISS